MVLGKTSERVGLLHILQTYPGKKS